jgi:hypothetical protein
MNVIMSKVIFLPARTSCDCFFPCHYHDIVQSITTASPVRGASLHSLDMLRRATPRLSVLKLTKSAPTIHRLHSVVNVNPAVHSSDAGFFTPTSQPSSSSSSQNPSQPPQKKGRYDRVSDHEYNVRVGRACDLLQATLPDFMRTGLVDYQRDLSSRSSGLTLLDVFTFRALMARGNGEEDVDGTSANDQVYDPIIHFYFRPAPPLTSATSSSLSAPTDEEAASVSFSGRSLYFASAHVLRHTLNVLFSDARVEVKKLRLERKGGQPRVEDVIHLRLEFIGHARVTGQEHNYTLIFRYEIDNDTGRIVRHTVERVEPAIGRKVSLK